jgi:predicted nucleotidyltransferase
VEIGYVIPRIIFETVVGSRAYGIHHKDSDYDRAGVMIPGKKYFFGWKKFEQFQGFDTDRTIYDIRKAVSLIKDNNPNMMDLLWMPERCIITMTPYWEEIINHRDWFVSKRVRYTYSGYAIAQLRRIKTHRKFLLNPPTTEPKREDFSLPETSIFPTSQLKAVVYAAMEFIASEEKPNFIASLDSIYGDYVIPLLSQFIKEEERSTALEWLQLGIKSQAKAFLSLGTKYLRDEYVEQAQNEVRYYNACREWSQYLHWKKHRKKARAELEEKFKLDTKHASHLVRLMRTGIEALSTGTINVDRTGIDAEELKAIRNGAWTFEQIEEFATESDKKLDELYKDSVLPKRPKEEAIHDLCIQTVDKYLQKQLFSC